MTNENMKNMEINEEAMENVVGGRGEFTLVTVDYYVDVPARALRSKPNMNADIVEMVYQDQIVTHLGNLSYNTSESDLYLLVRSQNTGHEGWIERVYLRTA